MSTNDPIEELFRDNQHGLDEKPRDLLWDRIEERLEEKSVQKKKTEWWKYATAASVVIGMVIGVWALLHDQDSLQKESTAPQIVYEKTMEVNEKNASEILDKLEENKQSVAIREEKKSVPEILESEMVQEPTTSSLKIPEPMMKPEPVYDIAPMAETSAAPALAKEKQVAAEEEIIVFRGTTPEKKEGNYVSQSKSKVDKYEMEDARRLGNIADTSEVFYENTTSDSILVNQFYVKTSTSDLKYKLISTKNDSLIYSNSTIKYPSEIIFIQNERSIKVKYKGDENYKNSQESKEIQKYVNENKESIFNTIVID